MKRSHKHEATDSDQDAIISQSKKQKIDKSIEDEDNDNPEEQTKSSPKRSTTTSSKEGSTSSTTVSPVSNGVSSAIQDFRVSKESLAALMKKGIESFFPIQLLTYDAIYDGLHVVGRARTGTGKTLAFSLPSIERLLATDAFAKKHNRQAVCRMLVLLPTRELAQQVAVEIQVLECSDRFRTVTLVGGLPEQPQLQALKQGGGVVVGTPGRTLDFLNRELLNLSRVKIVVLDEADLMLEMGFRDDVDAILSHVFQSAAGDEERRAVDDRSSSGTEKRSKSSDKKESAREIQVLLFSATLPAWVNSVSNKYMTGREKKVIDVVKGESNQTATGIRHLAIVCGFHQRIAMLGNVLHMYGGLKKRCIVFTETKAQANQISEDSPLARNCKVLHGDIQQKQREITLKAFKEGKFQILVATDVAARGLHVDDIDLVVQLEPPKNVDTFVHRAGRTGRAGTNGTSLIFFGVQDAPFLMSIEKTTGIKFKRVGVPAPSELIKAAAQRAAESLSSTDGHKHLVQELKPVAEKLVKRFGAVEAVGLLLFELSGSSSSATQTMSTLSGREGYKTYEMVFKDGVEIEGKNYIWKALRTALGDQSELTGKLTSMILRHDNKGCVFDVPPEILENWEAAVKMVLGNPRNSNSFNLGPVFELPDLNDTLLDSSTNTCHFSTSNPRALGRNGVRGGSNHHNNNNNSFGSFARSSSFGKSRGSTNSAGSSRQQYKSGGGGGW